MRSPPNKSALEGANTEPTSTDSGAEPEPGPEPVPVPVLTDSEAKPEPGRRRSSVWGNGACGIRRYPASADGDLASGAATKRVVGIGGRSQRVAPPATSQAQQGGGAFGEFTAFIGRGAAGNFPSGAVSRHAWGIHGA